MDLKVFNELTMTSANDAKNFISFLIGYNFNGKDPGKAIIGVYESFSEEIKKDEKAFVQVFHKFFLSYEITKENIRYYEQFSKYWSDANKDAVRKINPHWVWEKATFKNSLEFTKALSTYRVDYYTKSFKEGNDFIEENKGEIARLITKDKKKFNENMFKQRCWENLLKGSYLTFQSFCNTYGFDEIEIFKGLMGGDSYYGIKYYMNCDNRALYNIITNIDTIFEGTNFFEHDSSYYCSNKCNLLDVFVVFMAHKKYDLAIYLFDNYSNELTKLIKPYLGYEWTNKTIDITTDEPWKEFVKTMKENRKSNHRNYHNTGMSEASVEQIEESFTDLNKLLQTIKLDKELTYSEKKIKKLKV